MNKNHTQLRHFTLALTIALLLSAPLARATDVSGAISSDTTWTPAGSPYTLVGSLSVDAGVVLTIEPGVEVIVNQYHGLAVDGEIVVEGTAAMPVVIRGSSASAGWWAGIHIGGQASASFEYCTVRDAGYSGNAAGIYKTGTGELTLRNSTLTNSSGAGLRLGPGSESVISENNTFSSNYRGVQLEINTSFEDTTSSFSNNSIGHVTANGGTHTTDVTWRLSPSYAITITGTQSVGESSILTIKPGTVIKFYQYVFLYVDGQLVAQGTPESPIYFTCQRDDSVGGDSNNDADNSLPFKGWWGSLGIRNNGSAILDYCTVAWGGYSGERAGVTKTGTGSLSARHCAFLNTDGSGLRLTQGYNSFLSENNRFEGNIHGIGLGINTSFTDTTSTFSNNSYGQVTADGGTHTTDVSWELSPEFAILVYSTQTVEEGATLTMQPGTVVKFTQYSALIINGALNATGTAGMPIHFTCHRDDTVGGDTNNNGSDTAPFAGWWAGIAVQNNGNASLEHVNVAWAGYSGNAAGLLKTGAGSLSVRESEFRHTAGAGLRLTEGYGSFLSENNHFEANTQGIRLGLNTSFTDTTSTFTNNGYAQVSADGGTHSTSVSWELSPAYSILITGTQTVPQGATLAVLPGTVVKFVQYSALLIDGQLIAEGTNGSPVHFTCHRDDTVGGDSNNNGAANGPFSGWWAGISVRGNGSASFEHASIAWGGYGGNAAGIHKSGTGGLSVTDSVIKTSSGAGLRLNSGYAAFLSENNRFEQNSSGVRLGINTSFTDTSSTFLNNSFAQVAADGGTHTTDLTWELSPAYSILITATQVVGEDTRMTVLPGTVVKSLQYEGLYVDGELITEGTPDKPVSFTCYLDDTVGGDSNNNGAANGPFSGYWRGLIVRNSGLASLAHAAIAWTGYGAEASGLYKTGSGDLSLQYCTFNRSGGVGLRLAGNTGAVLSQYNHFLSNYSGVRLGPDVSFSDTTSLFTDNTIGPVSADGGTHTVDVTWELSPGYSILVTGSQTVAEGALLTLKPGVVLKFVQYAQLLVEGELLAAGLQGSPIHFTCQRDDSVGGDTNNDGQDSLPFPGWWAGLKIRNNGSATLEHCSISYGGYSGDYSTLNKSGTGSLALYNCLIQHSSGSGLRYLNSNGYSEIMRSRFLNNVNGVLVESSVEPVVLTSCHFEENSQYGVRNINSAEVDARNSWWGHASGPYHPGLNPDGSGDTVSDGVLFDPWRTNESLLTILSPMRSGTIVAGDTLRFLGSQVSDPSAGYLWDFGDGRDSSARNPGLLSFPASGVFEVTYASVADGVVDPLPESRSYSVVTNTGNHPDLKIQSVNVPSSIGIGQASTLDYTVTNTGNGTLTSTWIDRVYLSPDGVLDTGDLPLAEAGITRSLAPGASYQGSIPMTLPPVAEGAQNLILSVNDQWQFVELHRLNNEMSAEVSVLVPELEEGTTQQVEYDAGQLAHYYKLTVPAGQNLRIEFVNTNPGIEAFVRFAGLPSRTAYDHKLTNGSLIVPSPRTGDWFILVYGAPVAQPGSYGIRFDMENLLVDSASPASQNTATQLELTVSGAGFASPVSVELLSSNGTPYSASTVSVNSYTSLTATFDAGMLPPGTYDLRLGHDGHTASLPGAVQMIEGGQPDLYVDIISPSRMGYHQLATLYVEYGNNGDAPMPAPLIVITALQNGEPGALFTLDQSLLSSGFWTSAIPKGFSTSVRLLGGGREPGILQPGEHMRLPVYYAGWLKPWDFSYPPFEFQVRAFTTSDSHPMDWNYLKDTLQTPDVPDAAWDGIWQNFVANIGSTSGDFVRALSASATYLYRIGREVRDVHDLLAFELIKAKGIVGPLSELNSVVDLAPHSHALNMWFVRTFPRHISHRHRLGPLGYGWNHIWEIQLTTEPDGTVTILHGNGATRVFQPDSRSSSYFSSKGDPARLRKTAGSTYTLTEPDGTGFVFDQFGTLLRTQNRNGETVQLQYTSGRLTGLTHSNGSSLAILYNAQGLIRQVQDSMGHAVSFTYDGNKQLGTATDSQGRTTQYGYATSADPRQAHALTSIIVPGNGQQSFGYDSQGRLGSSGNSLGTTHYSYNQGELVARDPNGYSTTVSFDNHGVLSRVVDPDGGVTTLEHDALLNNTIIRSPDGSSMVSKYGADGSLKELIQQNGGTWTFRKGPYGQLSGVTSPSGKTLSLQYDSNGNLVNAGYPDGKSATYGYDSSGKLVNQTLPGGITETVTYNNYGLPLTMTYSDESGRSFTYSDTNKLLTATNAEGTTTFEYDENDNLAKVSYPNGLYLEFDYDAAGRPVAATDHNGRQSRYTYNDAGLLHQLMDGTGNELVRYSYDGVGRVSEKRFSTGARTVYERNGSGLVTRQTTFSPQGATLSEFTVAYGPNGLPITYSTDQGDFVYTYDMAGNLVRSDFHPLSGPVESTLYHRNSEGLLTGITAGGVNSPVSANSLGQTTQVGNDTIAYNGAGNISSRTVDGVVSGFSYNSAGQLTGMLTEGRQYQMRYDALGTPIELTTPDRTLKYLYGQNFLPHLFGEYDESGEAVRTYRYGLEMAMVEYAGNRYFPEYDPLKGETVLSLSAGTTISQLKALASPMTYLPFQPPYQFADPYVPSPVYYGTAMEGYMTLAYNAYKTGQSFGEWAVNDEGMDRWVGHYARNPAVGFLGGLAALPNAVNTVNDALKAFGPFHFVVQGGGKVSRGILDFFAKSPSLARGLGALGVIVGGVEAIDGISETWEQGKSVDVGDVVNFWNGSTSGPNHKIRHGLASATLAGIGLALVSAPALTVAAPVAAVATVAALISDNTIELQTQFWIWWDGLDVTGETIRGTRMAGSGDPNQKLGVRGYGEENYVSGETTLTYRIDFENRPEATAPAQVVIIRDDLPDEVDWDSFQILELGFGDINIPVAPGTRFFEDVVDYAYQDPEYEFEVEVHIEVNIENGSLFAIFYAIDPGTGLPPTVDVGFLPPEPEKVPDTYVPGEGRGQGHITYSVLPRENLPSGTPIRNIATIQFDFSLDIDTNQVDPMDPSKGTDPDKEALVTIDSAIPVVSVEALPELSPTRFLVDWGGQSASGMASFDVYFRENAGAWQPWLIGTTETSAVFEGDPYSVYDFYATGINNVGTQAPWSPVIQAFTTAGVDNIDVTIERTPDRKIKLSWMGFAGFVYQVQYSSDQSSWGNLGSGFQVGTDGEPIEIIDESYSFEANRFYRIIVSAQ